MADLLVDTDVFIDHLRGANEFHPKRHRVYYSVVTRAELFAGNSRQMSVLGCLRRSAKSRWTEQLRSERDVPLASQARGFPMR